MPTPEENETEKDFKTRCVKLLVDDGKLESIDSAKAVANYLWDKHINNHWKGIED